jgi:transcriptional regulator with XRE-family HTH domain
MDTTKITGVVPTWTVADRLRKAREITGLDKQDFARKVGLSRETVRNVETGRVEPRGVTLNAWAFATGVSVEWLAHGEDALAKEDNSDVFIIRVKASQLEAA